jgi:hypothetical protein
MLSGKIILIFIVPFLALSVGCTVASNYPTRSYQTADERASVDKIYNPPKEAPPAKQLEPFLKDVEGPALRVNGFDIPANDVRELYQYFGTFRKEDAITLKRDALMQYIQTYAVMSQWPDKIGPALQKIAALRDQALAGTDFNYLIVENSQEPGASKNAGDLGTLGRGQLLPIFEMHAITEPLNTISQPFPTIYGWHIIQVLERDTSNPEKPTFHARHLLLMHGLDPANGDLIDKNATRWVNLAKVVLLTPELDKLLPQYVARPSDAGPQSAGQSDLNNIKNPGK